MCGHPRFTSCLGARRSWTRNERMRYVTQPHHSFSLPFFVVFCCMWVSIRLPPEGAHMCTHIYTRIYIHTFYQTGIRKRSFYRFVIDEKRKRNRRLFTNGKLDIFRSCFVGSDPRALTSSHCLPYAYTHTQRGFVFSALRCY